MNHKKVQVVVISTSNPEEILLLRTNQERGGFWQNITGSVEGEESFLEAAKREVEEEIGITSGEMVELDHSFIFTDRFKREVIERPLLLILESKPKTIQLSEEHDKYEWIPLDQVKESHFEYESNFDACRMAIEHWRNHS